MKAFAITHSSVKFPYIGWYFLTLFHVSVYNVQEYSNQGPIGRLPCNYCANSKVADDDGDDDDYNDALDDEDDDAVVAGYDKTSSSALL